MQTQRKFYAAWPVPASFLNCYLMTKIFILVLLSTICSYGQFRLNSIGVAYLTGETTHAYLLKIVLPLEILERSDLNSFWAKQTNNGVNFHGEITFFDKSGEL